MSLDPTQSAPRRRRSADGATPPSIPPEERTFSGVSPEALVPETPSRTFRLPNGKTMTLATDRVRAKPAVAPQI